MLPVDEYAQAVAETVEALTRGLALLARRLFKRRPAGSGEAVAAVGRDRERLFAAEAARLYRGAMLTVWAHGVRFLDREGARHGLKNVVAPPPPPVYGEKAILNSVRTVGGSLSDPETVARLCNDLARKVRREGGDRMGVAASQTVFPKADAVRTGGRRVRVRSFDEAALERYKGLNEARRRAAYEVLAKGAPPSGRLNIKVSAKDEAAAAGKPTPRGCIGYARLIRGSWTCGFCVALAARGIAYSNREDAGGVTVYHANCDCLVVPVFDRAAYERDPGYRRARDLYKRFDESTRGQKFKGRGKVNAFNRFLEQYREKLTVKGKDGKEREVSVATDGSPLDLG